MSKRKQVYDGEWIAPVRKNYEMECCDCGLVHRLDFRLIPWRNGGKRIIFRAFRDKRKTAATRRKKKDGRS